MPPRSSHSAPKTGLWGDSEPVNFAVWLLVTVYPEGTFLLITIEACVLRNGHVTGTEGPVALGWYSIQLSIPQTFADICTGQGVSVLSCWIEAADLEADGRVCPEALDHIHSRHILVILVPLCPRGQFCPTYLAVTYHSCLSGETGVPCGSVAQEAFTEQRCGLCFRSRPCHPLPSTCLQSQVIKATVLMCNPCVWTLFLRGCSWHPTRLGPTSCDCLWECSLRLP